jgi:hypothetical protein
MNVPIARSRCMSCCLFCRGRAHTLRFGIVIICNGGKTNWIRICTEYKLPKSEEMYKGHSPAAAATVSRIAGQSPMRCQRIWSGTPTCGDRAGARPRRTRRPGPQEPFRSLGRSCTWEPWSEYRPRTVHPLFKFQEFQLNF